MSTTDKIIAFAAIFISCLALTVSIVQTRIMQKQSHAAVWPRITYGQSFGPDYFDLIVENEGVGPAIVKSINYTYQDSSISNIYDFIIYLINTERDSIGKPFQSDIKFTTILEGDVIAVGESVEVFSAEDSLAIELGKKYLLNSDLEIEYCSIYDHCWRMTNYDTEEI